jgi:hypothetical protein
MIDYLNFDSFNSTKISNDSFDATFTILTKYTNVKKIYLKNIEIPIGFPNIRSANQSNTLRFIMNGVTRSVSIPQSNYLSVTALLSALNASLITDLSGSGFTMNLTVINNIVTITTTGAFSSYSIITNTLSNILGISSAINLTAGVYNSPYLANIAYDTYIQMSFNIPSKFSTPGNVPSALKIPMNTNYSNILFYSTDRSHYDQALTIQDTNLVLHLMRVTLYDRFGFPLQNGNLDYSFTIAIEFDNPDQNSFHVLG